MEHLTLTDTHCHLDFRAFDDDRQFVLERALDAGVTHILNPGIDLLSSQAAIHLAEMQPEVHAGVGIHPNEAKTWGDTSLAELRELAGHPKVVAVGEIGLDYYRNWAPRELQMSIFRQQLTLAAELGKPVIIHNRQASEDMLHTLSEWVSGLKKSGSSLAEHPGVLHSFSGDPDSAKRAIDLGFQIGITGPVTFRNAPDLQSLVAGVPIENLLTETDAPFLTPHPHRGQRNEPAYVRLVADKIAEIHQQPYDKVAALTSANAARLFHWSE